MLHDSLRAPARRLTLYTALIAASAAAACSGRDGGATDSAAAVNTGAALGAGAAADSGMNGMDHSQMPGMNRPAARDSNQAFLRMMSDHHEGLVAMADSAGARLESATAKEDARTLRRKQDAEQTRMLGMLTRQYQDSVTPMIMPSNRAMLDSVVRGPQGAELDRAFYRQVIAHHREGIAMAEKMMPALTGEARQIAEKAVADQRREIQAFERRTAQVGAGGRS